MESITRCLRTGTLNGPHTLRSLSYVPYCMCVGEGRQVFQLLFLSPNLMEFQSFMGVIKFETFIPDFKTGEIPSPIFQIGGGFQLLFLSPKLVKSQSTMFSEGGDGV